MEDDTTTMTFTAAPRRFSFEINREPESQLSSPRTSCVSSASGFPPWTRSPAPGNTSPSRSRPLIYNCLASLHWSDATISCLAVNKDYIFTGSSSCKVQAWGQPTCTESGSFKTPSGQIRAILATGRSLATSHGDFRVRLWDITNMERLNNLKLKPRKIMTLPKRRSFFSNLRNSNGHKDWVSCLAINSVEKLLYTGSWDHTVKVWKLMEKACVDSFVAHDGNVNAIVLNQFDGCVFTCSSDGTVKIWRRVMREFPHILTMTLKFQPSPVNSLALSCSNSSHFLYSGSSDGLINFWEKEKHSGRYNHAGFLQGHQFSVLCLVTVEEMILSGSEDSTIRIWKRDDRNAFHACLVVIDGHHGPVKCLAAAMETATGALDMAARNLLVYSASVDQTLKVWRVKVKDNDGCDENECLIGMANSTEVKMSPVLSPSWVQKKIHGSEC